MFQVKYLVVLHGKLFQAFTVCCNGHYLPYFLAFTCQFEVGSGANCPIFFMS